MREENTAMEELQQEKTLPVEEMTEDQAQEIDAPIVPEAAEQPQTATEEEEQPQEAPAEEAPVEAEPSEEEPAVEAEKVNESVPNRYKYDSKTHSTMIQCIQCFVFFSTISEMLFNILRNDKKHP